MKKIFGKVSKGVKKVMNIPKDIYAEVINNDKARLILGITITGLGLGGICVGGSIIASVYIKVPQ